MHLHPTHNTRGEKENKCKNNRRNFEIKINEVESKEIILNSINK